ncbi:hypothetical protein BO78DRAFT_413555 [Aspergillus sclerotiicarbonarius CBS 121057]|uniref:Uncharacterized protein n=1 Tax=Aspergillus sclerotiicarbonarius (strain CBS 121057 / IBT 28362) TaxID=1448318 RepID=A0A319ENA6_ASPSB|nr:hypothetical protein BO78DRAFT_413555 [Aspergillus sclerotiicarbonarius CBS 121057]
MGLKKKDSSKARMYLKSHMTVDNLYKRLNQLEQRHLTDGEANALGIRFSSLDLTTGQTSQDAASFFLPNPKDEYNVSAVEIEYDRFAHHRGKKETFARLDALVDSYLEYGALLAEKFQRPSECIMYETFKNLLTLTNPWLQWYRYCSSPRAGRIKILRDGQYTDVEDARGFLDPQKPHRTLVTYCTDRAEDRVTVSELVMMVSWMLGGMRSQTYAYCRKGVPTSEFHMIFPVLLLSFMMPSHCRAIQGHFRDGQLHIQFTKNYDFRGPEYINTMNMFLKWSDPVACGDTRLLDIPVQRKFAGKEAPSIMIRGGVPSSADKPQPIPTHPEQLELPNTENIGPRSKNKSYLPTRALLLLLYCFPHLFTPAQGYDLR